MTRGGEGRRFTVTHRRGIDLAGSSLSPLPSSSAYDMLATAMAQLFASEIFDGSSWRCPSNAKKNQQEVLNDVRI